MPVRPKWKPFGNDLHIKPQVQTENIWFSSFVKHEQLDIVQKMQVRMRRRDAKLEEFEKKIADIDSGKTQEEMRK
jgi:hypothetical protein